MAGWRGLPVASAHRQVFVLLSLEDGSGQQRGHRECRQSKMCLRKGPRDPHRTAVTEDHERVRPLIFQT